MVVNKSWCGMVYTNENKIEGAPWKKDVWIMSIHNGIVKFVFVDRWSCGSPIVTSWTESRMLVDKFESMFPYMV